jgi:hypothetical protein
MSGGRAGGRPLLSRALPLGQATVRTHSGSRLRQRPAVLQVPGRVGAGPPTKLSAGHGRKASGGGPGSHDEGWRRATQHGCRLLARGRRGGPVLRLILERERAWGSPLFQVILSGVLSMSQERTLRTGAWL